MGPLKPGERADDCLDVHNQCLSILSHHTESPLRGYLSFRGSETLSPVWSVCPPDASLLTCPDSVITVLPTNLQNRLCIFCEAKITNAAHVIK